MFQSLDLENQLTRLQSFWIDMVCGTNSVVVSACLLCGTRSEEGSSRTITIDAEKGVWSVTGNLARAMLISSLSTRISKLLFLGRLLERRALGCLCGIG